jgi:hypothetical protein
MSARFLTGTNAKMFGQTLILMQSFAESGAGDALTVCDFGLTPAQRRFLAARRQLATLPKRPEEGRHSWYDKASLGDFIDGDPETVVWVDADMIVTSDPRPLVAAILVEMTRDGHCIAACPDDSGHDLGHFLRWASDGGNDCVQFRRVLDQSQIDRGRPYLNSGFFIVTSRRWLEDWKATTFAIGTELLFEQNAFNVVAWRHPDSVRLLDARRWNAHNDALGRLSFEDGGAVPLCDDQPVAILHATSQNDSHIHFKVVHFALGGTPAAVRIKAFRHKRLSEMQLGLLSRFLAQNDGDLAGCLADEAMGS